MKYLGIDYGSKRIGVAVSDETATLAFPVGTVVSGKEALEEVLAIAKENTATVVVLGESRNFGGGANVIMKDIEAFKTALGAAGLAVLYEPEFMTSALAAHQYTPDGSRKTHPAHDLLDASAAALILQSYLDRIKSQSEVE